MNPALLASGRQDWRTPDNALSVVRDALCVIDLDPCASTDPAHHFATFNMNPALAPAPTTHALALDGLAEEWRCARTFVNPPFKGNAAWVAKCALEAGHDAEVILLIPARTDTRYWHEHVAKAEAVCFWKGRLRFVDAPAPAPFPVAFVYWGPHPLRFTQAFESHGMVVLPGRR